MTASPYNWLVLAGIVISLVFWSRVARRDDRLIVIYVSALIGAFLGAKIVYLLAEGWQHASSPDRWQQWATGKTILGGLLGGYACVEIAKKVTHYDRITGDWFAVIVPFGILVGRIGCLLHGCCLGETCNPAWFTLEDGEGQARWPSVPVEILFNLAAIVSLFALRRTHRLAGQHLHLYLVGYGVFRFLHGFVRVEPRIIGAISSYQLAALGLAAFGVFRFRQRQRQAQPEVQPETP